MKTCVILMILFVAVIMTRVMVVARALLGADGWGEYETRKGAGQYWFWDYMIARDLADQEGLGMRLED
jgi:hypothetical protein